MRTEGFLPGDIVRIRNEEEIPVDVTFGWNEDMNMFSDMHFVIKQIYGNGKVTFYDMSNEMQQWNWHVDMIKHIEETEFEDDDNFVETWSEIMK